MKIDLLVCALTALIPMVVGFIWYGPMLFQNAWMNSLGFTEDDLKGGNMAMIFGLSYLFAFMLAFFFQISGVAIHQTGLISTLAGEPNFMQGTNEATTLFSDFIATYGDRFRTFKHGALHGFMMGVLVALPIIGTKSLFERRSWKNIWINVGYWLLTLALMGGVASQFATVY